MSVEANSHEIEDFALQPAASGPYGNQRIDDRIGAGYARAQSDFGFLGNGNQVVIQFEARLNRKTIHGGRIGKQIKLQRIAAVFGGGAEQFARHQQRCFAMKLDDFGNRVWVPGANSFGYNISVLTATLCHDLSDLARLAMYASPAHPFSKDRNNRLAGSRCKSSFRKSHSARECEKPRPTGKEKSLPRQKG